MVQIPARKLEVQEEAFCSANHSGQRLDAVLPDLFGSRYSSASAGKKAIRRKEVQVNGSVARTDMLLQEGDVVRVVMKVGSGAVWGSTAGKPGLQVAFEDEHMASIVKPQGLPTQGTGEGTVQGRIKYCLQPSHLPGALFRPHHVHRLDVNTGGLLLVAKTRAAGTSLAADLAQHKMQKRYLALVTGRLEGSGMIDYPLEGKPAVSLFRVEQQQPSASFGWLTWVSLWPKTGRTHQLRKHCAYIGHPILGDSHYMLHRKPDCQATQLADVQQHLPQIDDLAAAAAEAMAAGSTGAAGGARHMQEQEEQQQQQQQQERAPKRKRHEVEGEARAPEAAEQHAAAAQQQQQQQQGGSAAHDLQQQEQPMQQQQGGSAAHDLQQRERPMQQQQQQPLQQQEQQQQLDHRQKHNQQAPQELQQQANPQQQLPPAAAAAELGPGAGGAVMHGTVAAGIAAAAAQQGVDAVDPGSDEELTSAAEAAAGSSSSSKAVGIKQRGQQLCDGSTVMTCLWAVQLQLLHPVTRQPLDLSIEEQAEREYERICCIEAAAAAADDDAQGRQQQEQQQQRS